MLSLPDFIVLVYCLIDDLMPLVTGGRPLRSRGFPPQLRDSEVLTMLVVAEFLNIHDDKAIWTYFGQHWRPWFPKLRHRTTFTRQATNLWRVSQLLHQALITVLVPASENVFVTDGLPMPIVKYGRKNRSRLFRGEASTSYCAAKKEFYFGFKGHLLTSFDGIAVGLTVTPANTDEREAVWDLADHIRGWLLADKGYISAFFRDELLRTGVNLQTPLRSNMPDSRPPEYVGTLLRVRRLVETVISQFTEHLKISSVRSRDLWHLTARVSRKLLTHAVAVFLNKMFGRDPLKFDGLLAAA